MKKIIRLTESDMVRLVKRVISEQTYDANAAAQKIKDAVGGFGTDEDTIRRVLGELLKVDIQTLEAFYAALKPKGGLLINYLNDELMPSNMLYGRKGTVAGKIADAMGGEVDRKIRELANMLDQRRKDKK